MASWKGRVGFAVWLGGAVVALYWAHRVGEAKFVYDVTPLDEPIAIPVRYETYSGVATRVGEGRVKVAWAPVEPEITGSDSGVVCVGSIPAGGDRSYVLEIGGGLYVERGEFIEPLLAALRYYERSGELPSWLLQALNDPELDRATLAEVLAEMSRR